MFSNTDRFLNAIDSEILNVPSEMRSVHTPVMLEVVHKLIKVMKQVSQTFADMEPELLFMGSYFEGLKIVAPDEYDLNIVLKLPECLILDWTEVPAGFTMVQVRPVAGLEMFPEAHAWADHSNCLQAARVRYWLQSVIQRALNTLPSDGDAYTLLKQRVARSSTGPAYTIKLSGQDITGIIEVDLVPTFSFPLESLKKHKNFKTHSINFKEDFFLAVPKGPKGCDQALKEICWNIDCQQQELELLLDKYNLKPTIRLMKKFREMQGINLSSYCVKTLFFWEIINNDKQFWQTNSISYLLRHMLRKFLNCLKIKFIPNLWFPEQNMLPDIPKETLTRWVVCIHDCVLQCINDNGRLGIGLTKQLLNMIELEQSSISKEQREIRRIQRRERRRIQRRKCRERKRQKNMPYIYVPFHLDSTGFL